MDGSNGEWGMLVTALALLMVLLIFGSALKFILSAGRTNKKFRWRQLIDVWYRRRKTKVEPEVPIRTADGTEVNNDLYNPQTDQHRGAWRGRP